jgi:molecular chaperone HtpG
MQTGKIKVQTENIFPIIKKFLYSDHEIFLRELVSNAVDATRKLSTLVSLGEASANMEGASVEVSVDKEKRTITIKDQGIGMTADEVEKYINQIAFSGAEEFVQKYKDKADAATMIGHFGLGFYSAFMVASRVEIFTRSYRPDTHAVRWECDGSPEYVLQNTEKDSRGTDIVLHIADDSLEFLEDGKISDLLAKYCKFLPVEIKFEGKTVNNVRPAWTRKPSDLQDTDYNDFYKELYPFSDDSLFHIHLNVDYPFNLTGILYFPKLKNNFEVQKDKIQLYCNQVFVTDSVENIVPEFLTLLRGVIDSPDIPLNVSRSSLQSDANVKKISTHITKKVADKLEEIFKNDRAGYEAKWDEIRVFVQYGMLSDDKFYDRALKFAMFKNTEGRYFTLDEYRNHISALQTDKDGKLVHLYAASATEQHAYIDRAREKGYDVLMMDQMIDSHFLNMLEYKLEKVSFIRVDADTPDKLITKDEPVASKLDEVQKETLKPIVEEAVKNPLLHVVFESLNEKDAPMLITRPEFMRRMKEMNAMGGMKFGMEMPEMHNLVVNTNHPLMERILGEKNEDRRRNLARQAADLALLSQNMLKGEELTAFIRRSIELID